MNALLDTLAAWKPFEVLVVGDFMLDQHLYGAAERLSADAPVPVLEVRRADDRPGGAANVCLDLAAMRGRVSAVGVVGADSEAGALRRLLEAAGVDPSGLVTDSTRPTTVKRNLVGLAQARHPQKMFRVDMESREPLSPAVEGAVLRAVEARLATADIVCIEDYGKGVVTERLCQGVIRAARAAGRPVLVDPAAIWDFGKYRGATSITPNRTEAERATGLVTGEDAAGGAAVAKALLNQLDLECVVLTLDRHGALLLEAHGPEPVAVPTVARQVYDVTGAGDMMLAALAAGRANGLGWVDAVRLANAAAGLEVEVFGVEPIPIERIHADILRRETAHFATDAARPLEQVLVEIAAVRASGERVVFTNGCFDVLHAGHVALLERAATLGDFLVVGLNSDASVRRLKGEGRPVNTAADRARVLAALRAVDAVVVFDEETPARLVESILPDVLVKGADYAGREVVGREAVEAAGGRVELVELVEGRSTTATIARLRGGA